MAGSPMIAAVENAKHRCGHWTVLDSDADMVILQSDHAQPQTGGAGQWVGHLRDALGTISGAAAVGAKRLAADGSIFSMGEFVIHPKSFHHVGRGTAASCYRFAEEVDAIAGGVMAVDAEAFAAAGGQQRLDGELGAIDLCMALRAAGGRCITVPQVVVADEHSPSPNHGEAEVFQDRWGFDWNAADLDKVRQRHRGAGLLWHPRFHTPAMPFAKYVDRPAMHWQSYQQVDVYRQRADHLAGLVRQLCPAGRVLDLGCGDGLFAHLFAQSGAQVVGLDPEPCAIEQAQIATNNQTYPASHPQFVLGTIEQTALPDASFDLVAMLDVIEHLPNAVATLRQAARLLKPHRGHLLITTPAWQYGASSDPVYHVSEYTMHELTAQLQNATDLNVAHTGQIKGVYRDLIVIGQKSGATVVNAIVSV